MFMFQKLITTSQEYKYDRIYIVHVCTLTSSLLVTGNGGTNFLKAKR